MEITNHELGLADVHRDQRSEAPPVALPGPDPTVAVRGLPGVVIALLGALTGLIWGAIARAWMRFISTEPEFSWSGTIFIVVAFGLFGLGQGVALAARRAGWGRPGVTAARAFGGLGMVPIFAGAGAVMLPTVLGGGLAWARRDWPRWARSVLVVVASAPPLLILFSLTDERGWSLRSAIGWLWMLVIYGVVVRATAATLAPQPDGWRMGTAGRILTVTAAVLLVGVLSLAMVGTG